MALQASFFSLLYWVMNGNDALPVALGPHDPCPKKDLFTDNYYPWFWAQAPPSGGALGHIISGMGALRPPFEAIWGRLGGGISAGKNAFSGMADSLRNSSAQCRTMGNFVLPKKNPVLPKPGYPPRAA